MTSAMDLTPALPAELLEKVLLGGDLAKLTPAERLVLYRQVCEGLGLNPLTRPFQYLSLNGKLVLYAAKDCTEQLRKIHGVSVDAMEHLPADDVHIVTVKGKDRTGRSDMATGAVPVGKLTGEAKANAIMKAETKAKRRLTLSICGLGMLDESEVESIRGAKRVRVDAQTGEVLDPAPPAGEPDPEAEAAMMPRARAEAFPPTPALADPADYFPVPAEPPVHTFILDGVAYDSQGMTEAQYRESMTLAQQVNAKRGKDTARRILTNEFQVVNRLHLSPDAAEKYLIRLRELAAGDA